MSFLYPTTRDCRSPWGSLTEELAIPAAIVSAPRSEPALLLKQLIGKIDVRLAVQQIAQVQPWPLQMNCVDLEISPVQRSIGIVMIDFALPLRIFGALNGKRETAVGTDGMRIAAMLIVDGRADPPERGPHLQN